MRFLGWSLFALFLGSLVPFFVGVAASSQIGFAFNWAAFGITYAIEVVAVAIIIGLSRLWSWAREE